MRYKPNICIITLLLICLNVYSQGPLRQLYYETTLTKMYAVPKDTDINSLSSYDLTNIRSVTNTSNTDMMIDGNRDLTVILFNHQMPRFENDYEFEIGKVVTTKHEINMYNHQGDLLLNNTFSEVDEDFTIHEDAIDSYGLMPEISISDDLIQTFISMGFTVSTNEDGVLSAINDSIELYYDTQKLIMEMRIFEKNQLQISDWKQYQKIENSIIPKVFVMTTYDTFTNGIRLQISEITNYNNYTIINSKGETIVSFEEKATSTMSHKGAVINQYTETPKKESNIKIFPNPASNNINLEIPLFGSERVKVEIINSLGLTVLALNDVENDNTINIDVSNLKEGVYMIKCSSGKQFKTGRFIKQ